MLPLRRRRLPLPPPDIARRQRPPALVFPALQAAFEAAFPFRTSISCSPAWTYLEYSGARRYRSLPVLELQCIQRAQCSQRAAPGCDRDRGFGRWRQSPLGTAERSARRFSRLTFHRAPCFSVAQVLSAGYTRQERTAARGSPFVPRSEEHTSEL